MLLRDNEQVPADIIVLSTSNADALCFIETKNLDGETNLKVRGALKATSAIASEEDLEHARFFVDSEPPHANLYTYNGVLRYRPANWELGGKRTSRRQSPSTSYYWGAALYGIRNGSSDWCYSLERIPRSC